MEVSPKTTTTLEIDAMTWSAITAILARVTLEDIRSVLSRLWRSEDLSEEQIEDFSSALILLYYNHFHEPYEA